MPPMQTKLQRFGIWHVMPWSANHVERMPDVGKHWGSGPSMLPEASGLKYKSCTCMLSILRISQRLQLQPVPGLAQDLAQGSALP